MGKVKFIDGFKLLTAPSRDYVYPPSYMKKIQRERNLELKRLMKSFYEGINNSTDKWQEKLDK